MANVRLFGYSGIVQLEQRLLKQFNSDSTFVRQEPYLWASGPIALNGATPVASTVQPSDDATFVVVEVDTGAAVRYELNPNGPTAANARSASANSPKLTGENLFQWFRGATMSFVDQSVTG
jgi:hypothetical protein